MFMKNVYNGVGAYYIKKPLALREAMGAPQV